MRAVQFDHYGNFDVLYVAEVDRPTPGPNEVLVRVRAAGLNPGEIGIRSGAMDEIVPAHFPEGQGTDLSGVVTQLGAGVEGVAIGQEVIGWSDRRGAQADFAVLPWRNIVSKPGGMSWDTAAAIPTVGATATSALAALDLRPGETLVIGGASGGVGLVATQLALRQGVLVIGTASERNHDYLRSLGATPVAYGDGAADNIRAAAPNGVDAFADCHGEGNIELALDLGVKPDRINTIIDFPTAQRVGTKAQGMYQLASIHDAVAALVPLVDAGDLQIPIKARYPLDQVQQAYERLGQPGGPGKIVLQLSGAQD